MTIEICSPTHKKNASKWHFVCISITDGFKAPIALDVDDSDALSWLV